MEVIAGEAINGIASEAVKPLVQSLVDPVINGAQYICCLNSYVENYEKEKEMLAPKLQDVKTKIGKASGVSRVKNETLHWADKADNLIQVDTRRRKKWCFGNCPNCIWRYQRGKELADKTLEIQKLMERCSSKIVVGPVDVPDMKYHRLSDFISFESRQLKFQQLMEALKDENCNMIGLRGMGGLGKTSLATEVGVELEAASKFDKVILLVLSKPPDYKKNRQEIAKHLDLTLEEETEEDHSKKIWSKITNMKEKLLIILDDVWEVFDMLKVLGIPSSDQHKGCSVLITTRNAHVCAIMGCQKTIHLEMLPEKESLNLFLARAGIHNSSSLKGVAKNIVKQCVGVPVAIVAVARMLKDRHLVVWKEALRTLQNTKSLLNVNEGLTDVYKCLKLSYDNLKNETAKKLFLICSIFPEDSEISIDTLSIIGIGVGLWGDVDKFYAVRSKVLEAIQELIDSCLLLNVEKERVKMHDLVHEVALWIASKDIQSITDFKVPIKGDFRYLFLNIDEFPNEFDVAKVEILITRLKDLNVPDAFFAKMTRLKVLYLVNDSYGQIFSSPSFLYSLQSLKDIRSLTLKKLILGDISILGNLPSLQSLRLNYCSIIELPKGFMRLMKLRVLQVYECEIEMNNPFEVIEQCSQLEELTFVQNKCEKERKDAFSPNVSPPALHRYQISSKYLSKEYNSISRCFKPDDLRHLISEATFKQLVGESELLMLGGYEETGWKNLIPDIVYDGGMNDLNTLHLYSWPEIQCLIDTNNHRSDVIAFTNLVELHLNKMNVEVLCQGFLPSSFLAQLEIIKLNDCPLLTSIFQSFTAQSLEQLEELTIINCNALECIITNSSSGSALVGDNGDNDRKSYELILPKLKTLQVEQCDKLKIILPVHVAGGFPSLEKICICNCQQLEYIFDKFQEEDHVMSPLLKQMELFRVPSLIGIYREPISLSIQRPSSPLPRDKLKEKLSSSDTHAFSWAQLCCFLHKSRTTIEETNVATSKDKLLDGCTIPISGLHVSKKWFDSADILTRQLLNFYHVKKMNFANLSLNSESLSSLSIASMILWEELTIRECIGLKTIITGGGYDYNDQINYIPIFPKLEKLEIENCKDMEFLILSTVSMGIENLKSLTIKDVPKLNYAVGKYNHEDHLLNQNQNVSLQFHLPALEALWLCDVPKLVIKYFTELRACSDVGQLNQKTTKELDASVNAIPPFQAAHGLLIQSFNNIKEMTLGDCSNLISLFTLPTASMILMESLTIKGCQQLKCIVADEGDTSLIHMTHNSIFPKLKELSISDCGALEYLFLASIFRSLIHLESLEIDDTPQLKYVFGSSHHEDNLSHENHNIQIYIDFPALKAIDLSKVPNLVRICPKNYCLRGLCLKSITLDLPPEFMVRFFIDFMVCETARQQDSATIKVIEMQPLQTLESLSLCGTNNEEIFNLTEMDAEKNEKRLVPLRSSLQWLELRDLSELRNIYVGSNNILSLNNLTFLKFTTCKKLEVIFSASTFRSLPMLKDLSISDCEELVYIIEEDNKESVGEHLHHQPYFPNLSRLTIECCNRLKYLFCITMFGILPKLSNLSIKEAPNLKHVLIRRDETKETFAMKDVLPSLWKLKLDNLPSLVSVCQGIDFRTLEKSSKVNNCFNFSFYETSTTTQLPNGPKIPYPELDAKTKQQLSSNFNLNQLDMGEAKGRQGLETQQSPINSRNFTRGNMEATKEIIEEDVTYEMPKITNLSSDSKVIGHLSNEEIGCTNDLAMTDTQNTYPMVEFLSKEVKDERIMTDPQQSTIGTPNFAKDELVGKELQNEKIWMSPQHPRNGTPNKAKIIAVKADQGVSSETLYPSSFTSEKKVSILLSPNLIVPPTEDSKLMTAQICEEEEEEGSSLPKEKPETSVPGDVQVSDKSQALATVSSGEVRVDPRPLMGREEVSSYSRGQTIEHHDAIQSNILETNQASVVPGVQEIVDMMKLEGFEPSILAKALETHPKLILSANDRSTQMLCMSYNVLLDIFNILTTRTPFTITEADKKLLAEKLKDAYFLGFDKDWLDSIKSRVFDCETSQVDHIQEDLKRLDDDLKTNEAMVAAIRDEEVEAARVVELAQQKHANAVARHTDLLKARQDILARRHQCWEILAAKNRHFGF